MILDLREYENFPAQAIISGDSETLNLEYDGFVELKKLDVKLDIQKSSEEYFCQGTVEAVVLSECFRCAEKFDKTYNSNFDFIVCDQASYEEDESKVEDSEDYAFFIGSDLRADISDVVRQAIILSADMKPLCSESCLGLCSQCGTNLNEKSCSCKKEDIDPRWDGLKKLSEQNFENKEQS